MVSSANSGYGLINGGPHAQHLSLTSRGEEVIGDNEVRAKRAVLDALFGNEIFTAFVQRFADRPLPNEEVAADYLKDHHGLSQKDAEACFRIMKQNLVEFGLVEEASGRQVILSRVTAEDQLGDDNGAANQPDETPSSNSMKLNGPEAPEHLGGVAYADQLKSGAVYPQIAFNIQIQLPENAHPETYDAIFRNIAIHLLGRDEDRSD